MSVSAQQLADLMALGLDQETVLAIVTIFERDVTRNVTRDGSSRSAAAIRAAKYREKIKKQRLLAEANDAAESVTAGRDALRDGVTKACDLSSLLTEFQGSKEEVIEEESFKKEQQPELLEGRKKVSRGTRLSADAKISDADHQFARDAGMTTERIAQAWAEFVDYWIGVPGQRGTKLNWSATWRNRVRAVSGGGGSKSQKTRFSDPHDWRNAIQ